MPSFSNFPIDKVASETLSKSELQCCKTSSINCHSREPDGISDLIIIIAPSITWLMESVTICRRWSNCSTCFAVASFAGGVPSHRRTNRGYRRVNVFSGSISSFGMALLDELGPRIFMSKPATERLAAERLSRSSLSSVTVPLRLPSRPSMTSCSIV